MKLIPYNFDDIREDLKIKAKTFYEGDNFDTEFEGSNLSRLIDIIAYDSHTQNINHQAQLRENFITTATTRANVIRAAKRMGYIPQRALSYMYRLDVKLPVSNNFILKQGTKFTQGDQEYTYLGLDKSIDTRQTVKIDNVNEPTVLLKFRTLDGTDEFTCLRKSDYEYYVPDEAQITPERAQVKIQDDILGTIETWSVQDGEARLKLDTTDQTQDIAIYTKKSHDTTLILVNDKIVFEQSTDFKIRDIQQVTSDGVSIFSGLELSAINLGTQQKNIVLDAQNVPAEDILNSDAVLDNNRDLHIALNQEPLSSKLIEVVLTTPDGTINCTAQHIDNNNIEVKEQVQVRTTTLNAGSSSDPINNLSEVISVKSNGQNIYDYTVQRDESTGQSTVLFEEPVISGTVLVYTETVKKDDIIQVKVNYRTVLDNLPGTQVTVNYTTDNLDDDAPDMNVTISGTEYLIKSFKNDLLIFDYTEDTFNAYDNVFIEMLYDDPALDNGNGEETPQGSYFIDISGTSTFIKNDLYQFEVKEGVLEEEQTFTINSDQVKSNSFIFEAQDLEQDGILLTRGDTVFTERKTLLSTSREYNTFVVQETDFKNFYEVRTRLAGTGSYLLQGQTFTLRTLKSKGTKGELQGTLVPEDTRIQILNVERSQRGKDGETTEEIRTNAQVIRETALRAVTAQDYVTLLETRPNVIHANVVGSEELQEEAGEVHIYVVPDTLNTSLTTTDGRTFSTSASVDQLTDAEKLKVKEFLLYKKVITIKNTVEDVQYIDFSLDIRVRDSQVLTDEHRATAVDVSQKYFETIMRFNSGYRNSELISLIQDELTDQAAITIDFKMTGKVKIDTSVSLTTALSIALVEHGTQTSVSGSTSSTVIDTIHGKFRRVQVPETFELVLDETNTESIDFIHNVYPRLTKIEFN